MARGETDRGWAWTIVIGVTVINLAVLPVQQCFGLIFAERFTSLGITATQTSLILHLNGTITCSLGLISGPMMKRFAFRQVAYFGGLTVVLGICAAAFAVSLPTLIITYCVIIGVGQGIIFPATTLALNTYFRKKRNVAMGLAVTMTGLGPILMPLLIDIFLERYATTGTLIILAGIATHSFVGASLLIPFKAKKEISAKDKTTDQSKTESGTGDHREAKSKIEKNLEDNITVQSRLLNEENSEETEQPNNRVKNKTELKKEDGRISFLKTIATTLDLDLLRDNRYIAVVLGMAVSLVAETNFNVMIPFVLAELASLDRTSIAMVMSIQAAADITGRLCVPLLAQKAGWRCRNLYVISLLGSTFGRTILSTWGNLYAVVIGVFLIVGLAKGTKAVFQSLIIPDYVPLERLPAASGIQMVCNGILSISVGPLIGLIRDSTNSYVSALYFTSFLSLSCVFLWLISGLWTPCANMFDLHKQSSSDNQENSHENV
ncbi:monocarboxylate transporter 6-like isoform X1 [Pseudomyrmex gracilis]|uniref:monocarboxylate transporter 6-like isoform X1 n=1 Tax=Pseudomyrmex gracilis TaxID=219809 RepID=UPI000995B7BA|nr:monocarboxylate transporter 6-like isoform X1 [Pseudomyrmex gracilis]